MRFLHTGDWHLGRLFYGLHLTSDQAHVLDQMVDMAREARVDAVLISGDVYDRSVPPTEAVELLDQTLARLTREVGAGVVAIAGNHDSPQRLGFGSRLMREAGVTLAGLPAPGNPPLVLSDGHGPVAFCPVPYAEPALARQILSDPGLADHAAALDALAQAALAGIPQGARRVILAHAFVGGGLPSDSERPLSMGGADQVPASIFQEFHYAALGHLHRRQSLSGGDVHYPGSLLPYSFAEAGLEKSVTLVEMDARGRCSLEFLPLSPRHPVRIMEGRLEELLQSPPPGVGRDDYLMVRLTDPGALFDPMGRLRRVYPNLMHLERPAIRPEPGRESRAAGAVKEGPRELFQAFFRHVEERELRPGEDAALVEVLEGLAAGEREAGS